MHCVRHYRTLCTKSVRYSTNSSKEPREIRRNGQECLCNYKHLDQILCGKIKIIHRESNSREEEDCRKPKLKKTNLNAFLIVYKTLTATATGLRYIVVVVIIIILKRS